jgi:hypothetical protein
MKKTFVLAIALFALCALQPVFSQSWLAGGSLSFRYSSTDLGPGTAITDPLEFGIQPVVLYALNDTFDVGGVVGLSWKEDSATTFTIGPVGRFNFLDLDRVAVFALGYLTFSTTSHAAGGDNTNTINLMAGIGGDIIITDNMLFFAEIGGVQYSHLWRGDYNEDTFTIGLDTQGLRLGVMFLF